MKRSQVLSRSGQIKADLARLRERHLMACPDWFLDYAAKEIEKDEEAGLGLWPSAGKGKTGNGTKDNSVP